ncbi:MAG: hypothetical protein HFK02_04975 [Clostridia bacterium]|jgi:predicted amidohydrolase|nr:hypothetical protein [Clostridia bacterium]
MIICVAAGGSIKDAANLPRCDIAVFGFKGLGEVDYESELRGVTDKFEDCARLSKTAGCGVVCACKTKSRGILRKSVAVADRGKLLGISDMTHVIDCEDWKSGAGLGFYSVGGYKIGLIVENDLLFPECFNSLSLCGCNLIIAVAEELKDNVPPLLIRAYSYLYGVPVVMCAGNMAYFSEVSGAIAGSAQQFSMFEITPQNRYHLITSRTRGLFVDGRKDY